MYFLGWIFIFPDYVFGYLGYFVFGLSPSKKPDLLKETDVF